MARQWLDPATGITLTEDGVEEYLDPSSGATINEDQAAAAGANPKGPLGMPLHGPFGGPI